jgi:chromosomal replication initiator protein
MINLINRNGFYVRANTPIPSMDLIIHEVSSISKISVKELRSNSRKGDTVAYRQLIAYIVKNRTNKSLKKIGIFLGGRDHSTIIHSIGVVKNMIYTKDAEFMIKYNKVKHLLKHE